MNSGLLYVAASINWGFLFVGIPIMRALYYFGSRIRPLVFGDSHVGIEDLVSAFILFTCFVWGCVMD